MTRLLLGALMMGTAFTASLAEARTLVFHAVPRVSEPPHIDGDLTDPAWGKASVIDTYYEYWMPEPGLGVLDTELRIVYDDRGIYVAVLNHEEDLANLRANITVRDDPRLWQDDSAELYFDPAALGVGYSKFVVNSRGVQQDLRRLDAAVTLNDWSGYGWEVATGKTEAGWTIEAFFPWSDLGARAAPGDLWMFNHVRYAYTTGSFQGVTWSPGGAYNRPENFGYLYFADSAETSPQHVLDRISDAVAPPWRLPTERGIHVSDERGEVQFFESEVWLERARTAAREALGNARSVIEPLGDEHAELAEELDELEQRYGQMPTAAEAPAETLDQARQLDKLTSEIDELYWRGRLHNVLAGRER